MRNLQLARLSLNEEIHANALESKRLFNAGPTAKVTITDEFREAVGALRVAVQNSIGQETRRRIWPYRDASGSYVAVDVDGDQGSISITMAIVGETDLSSVVDVQTVGDQTICLSDGVDAFYLIQGILP